MNVNVNRFYDVPLLIPAIRSDCSAESRIEVNEVAGITVRKRFLRNIDGVVAVTAAVPPAARLDSTRQAGLVRRKPEHVERVGMDIDDLAGIGIW